MAEIRLAAEPRTEFGKGAARRIRREDKVPAVVYGHGHAPVHLTVSGYDLMMALKTPNALLSVPVDGKEQLVLPKAVQRDPIKGFLRHIDLIIVSRGEKVAVEIPIHTEGDLAPGANLLEHVLNTLPVKAEATHVPESVTISIEGLDAGASVLAKDIALPSGTELDVEEDAVVLHVVTAQAEPAAEEEAAEEAAEGAEA
ncbi:50S ribosomal protein L25/general stress protein Ctc [Phaeacidiphilus oryzae]|uniref:50S ribosomal protein L25/general stress protein Ctc n=1 Tax=Phaeacidiphilus oryzae TaxID=348818 RepID=UPI000561CD9B|nr:50S ribosomal protein L25/general stress protein Ctc [Phaeacidiphilus oryzae]